MKIAKLAIAAAALAAAPALANDQVVAGATVTGPEGNTVGTIETVADGQVVLDTGKHKVPLAVDSFGKGETGPTITVTKAQIDQMMDEQVAAAHAKRDAALVASAAVVSAKGAPLGVIDSVDGDDVIVALAEGPVALKREHFAVDANGQLMALFTVEQIEQAVAAAAPAADAAS
ncbi:hypothetical protein [Qipengyuania oceanensis]|uniref:PRC-barrel domain-containing protein n=1 Tax=Qipengyuania oceanensis TaxID=1463597 RepID=A0A844YIC1_9SPHN|nr:hypothetical protein [Qipengyuania oceanensis]MXO63493.1 hypothetical protein [Qipengyuania oceanensis]